MGYVYLYTGTGAGKTTNALGLALRSIGHGHRVVIIQFLKWWKNTGEYKFRKLLPKQYEIYQFGREGWIGLDNLSKEDKKKAEEGLKMAEKMMKTKPNLLVLDEINLAVHTKMLDVKDVLKLLEKIPDKTNVVLTGRYAPKELIERAEFVNEIKEIKYPAHIPAQEGIQY